MPKSENPNPSSLFERAGLLEIPVLLTAMSVEGLFSKDLKDKPEMGLNISDVLEEKDPENQAKYLEALLAKLSNTDIDQNVKQVLIQQYKDFPQDYSYQDKVFWFQDIFNKLNIDTSITIPTSELVIPDITATFPKDQKESLDPRLAELRSRYEEMNREPKGGDPVQTFLEEYRRASASYQTEQILKGVAEIGEQNQVEPTSNEPVVEKEREREFDRGLIEKEYHSEVTPDTLNKDMLLDVVDSLIGDKQVSEEKIEMVNNAVCCIVGMNNSIKHVKNFFSYLLFQSGVTNFELLKNDIRFKEFIANSMETKIQKIASNTFKKFGKGRFEFDDLVQVAYENLFSKVLPKYNIEYKKNGVLPPMINLASKIIFDELNKFAVRSLRTCLKSLPQPNTTHPSC